MEGTEQPDDVIIADLYIDYNLVKKDERIPIYYKEWPISGGVLVADLIDAARDRLYGVQGNLAKILWKAHAPTQPLTKADFYQSARGTFVRTKEHMRELNEDEGYVAINFLRRKEMDPFASPFNGDIKHQFPCSICSLDAEFANLAVMEPFCSDACHDVFLSNQ